MRNNTGITFIPSKGCRDCGSRIFYNQAKREYCDDDGSKGFIRHNCKAWKPIVNNDILVDGINHLERQNIEISAEIVKLRKSLYEIGQAVFSIQNKVAK